MKTGLMHEICGAFDVIRAVLNDNVYWATFQNCNWVPIKVRAHFWKVYIERLPTRFELAKRGVNVSDVRCPVCKSVDESVQHLFFDCSSVVGIWEWVGRWCGMDLPKFSDGANPCGMDFVKYFEEIKNPC